MSARKLHETNAKTNVGGRSGNPGKSYRSFDFTPRLGDNKMSCFLPQIVNLFLLNYKG